MKTLIKVIAVAVAFGLGSVAALPTTATTTAPPTATQGAPTAQPSQVPGAPSPSAVPAPSAATASTATTPSAQTPAGVTPAGTPAYSTAVSPRGGVGMPDGRMGLQDQYSPIGREAAGFHNRILMPVITLISLFVLALMAWVILRYRRAAHPVPSRTTHNTVVEVAWTLLPVLILVVIAIPSIRLLAHQYSPPIADLTIKVIGNQWYWSYEYPDHGVELTSNMLPEAGQAQPGQRPRTEADGPRLLAVDERVVVPVNATVKLIVTSADVLHSFAMPAFWVKMDAVPGRLNETWFRAEAPGVFFGQCSELCGSRHAYMPIAIEVVSQADFQRWIASRGGRMPGAQPAGPAPGTPVSPTAATAPVPAPPPPGETPPANTVSGATTPATSRQGATNPTP